MVLGLGRQVDARRVTPGAFDLSSTLRTSFDLSSTLRTKETARDVAREAADKLRRRTDGLQAG